MAAGLLVGGLSAGSASAADLGGNCCADLEERIAELEATTARKGNRKVSLTVSGWVAEQVMWWDDGQAKGTYVTGLGTTLATNVKFTGQATIMPGWYAGYVLHLEADEHDPLAFLSQNVSTGPTTIVTGAVDVLQSYWFVKSDHLGKVSVGLQSAAADNAAILVDGSGSLVPANWVLFDNGAFFIRSKVDRTFGGVGGVTWGGLGFCNLSGGQIGGDCQSNPTNVVRYDSPTWSGFSVSATWGQDSYWDMYARYAGEWNGIKIAATTGWSQNNGCTGTQLGGLPFGFAGTNCVNSPGIFNPANISGDTSYWQSGLYVEHVPTGVWLLANYGREQLSDMPTGTATIGVLGNLHSLNTAALNDNPDHWYIKGGLRERWSQLGHTVLYGFYDRRNDMINATDVGFFGITGSRTNEWGLGVVHEVDAAAMSFWLQYDHFDASVSCGGVSGGVNGCFNVFGTNQAAVTNLDNMQLVKFGALINY